MHPAGTFRYCAVVPETFQEDNSTPWPVQPCGDTSLLRASPGSSRLTGLSPRLVISDGGPTPNPGVTRPAVSRSRLTLSSSRRENATVSSASFYVASDLIRNFQAGDTLYLSRTPCAGLGLSLHRKGQLVFAVGAILSVPMGPDVLAEIPGDLVAEAEAAFKRRDPDFELPHIPLQISVLNRQLIMFSGRKHAGAYDIWVEHGWLRGMPGEDECAAITLTGVCGSNPAISSALLLDSGDFEMTSW